MKYSNLFLNILFGCSKIIEIPSFITYTKPAILTYMTFVYRLKKSIDIFSILLIL